MADLPPGYHFCAALTKRGTRCRRLVSEGWVYCGSHQHLRPKGQPGGTVDAPS